jgi:predicted AAA+ superfamily ATPase
MKNNPAKISRIYERDLIRKINPYLNKKEIISVIGPRQSGKTTILQYYFRYLTDKNKKCLFLTFEKKSDLEVFEKDIENFKKLYVLPYDVVFIDEFQYAQEAGQKLKYLYDTTNVKFLISGSSSLKIKEIGKYLVGRVFTFYLYPFSFAEFLKAKNKPIFEIVKPVFNSITQLFTRKKFTNFVDPIKSDSLKKILIDLFYQYLIFGGYPRVLNAKNEEEKKLVLSSIGDNYLLREIRSLLNLATENELLLLAKFLSLQVGNLISYTELSNHTHLSYNEVKRHIKILEETFILDQVLPFFRNKRTELVKNPKVYFIDTGFRNYIINNFSKVSERNDIGALAENFVFATLKEASINISSINFWRTKSQAEVDFVAEIQGGIIPVEVKYAPLGKGVIGKSLFSFIDKYQPEKAIVTTNDSFGKRRVGKTTVYFIPIFYFSMIDE